jgi:hypothetical protein
MKSSSRCDALENGDSTNFLPPLSGLREYRSEYLVS